MATHETQNGATFPRLVQNLQCGALNGSDSSAVTALAQQIHAQGCVGETQSLLSLLSDHQHSLQMLAAAASTPQRLQPAKISMHPAPFSTPTSSQHVSPVIQPWSGGRKRGRQQEHDEPTKRRRGAYAGGRGAGEKQNKGLRHFSQLVCEKVREKGTTTYNEVADELVKELGEVEKRNGSDAAVIDQKNIRRRVYDALNVLMAMNIISKEKKEIHWIGLPTNSVQECEHIQEELSEYEQRISSKKAELHELVIQILMMKNLMKRNRERAKSGDALTQNSAIGLPFILVNTNKQTTIDCSISSDKSEYVFNFDSTFELHRDVDVLKKLGLDSGLHSGQCTQDSLQQAKAMLPKVFETTLDEMVQVPILPQASPHTPTPLPSSSCDFPLPLSEGSTSTPTNQASSSTAAGTTLTPIPGMAASPLALALGTANSPASASSASAMVAAAISTLKQLTQSPLTNQPQLAHLSPSSSSSSQPALSPASLKPGTVTARPLNFVSSPASVGSPRMGLSQQQQQQPSLAQTQLALAPLSPLVKSQLAASTLPAPSHNACPSNLSAISMGTNKSPGTKIVTVQPLPNSSATDSVAEILASLQQSSAPFLKHQQQASVPIPSSSLHEAVDLLNGLATLAPVGKEPAAQANGDFTSILSGAGSSLS